MLHRIALRPALIVGGAVLLGLVFPAVGGAASAPPPVSNTTCWGTLKPAPTADDTNNLNYQFHCNGPITAYTIVVNRGLWDATTIDDFDPSPLTTLSDGSTVDPRTNWTCEGTLPADGLNCNSGSGGSMAAWSDARGSFDTSDPYCGAAPTVTSGKHPKVTPRLPRALVQLVVSDATGAEDGPFLLFDTAACHTNKAHTKHHHGRSAKS